MAILREEKNFTLLVCEKCKKTLWKFKENHKEIYLISAGFRAQCYECKPPKTVYSYCENCGVEYDENITPNGMIKSGDDMLKVCLKCLNESINNP
jgi:hypothetical protein